LILANSKPGTRILLRSAAMDIEFFPQFVMDAVHFRKDELEAIHKEDRVGTYGSVYLGIVKE
jgi:S-adenosylmethionine-diacylglycerol 3-amino-3-carboxypropyl transferase